MGKCPWDNGEMLNVKSFGAVGDGATDDASALQAALDAIQMAARPRTLYFPAGIYCTGRVLDITSTQGVTIFGDGATS